MIRAKKQHQSTERPPVPSIHKQTSQLSQQSQTTPLEALQDTGSDETAGHFHCRGAAHPTQTPFGLPLHTLTELERDHFEERAAILEFDAGLTRSDAERRAWISVVRNCR